MESFFLVPGDALWEDFLRTHRHDFYHTSAYVRIEAERMAGAPCALLVREGKHAFFLPLILRPLRVLGKPLPGVAEALDAISPYGFPCPLMDTPGGKEDADSFCVAALKAMVAQLSARNICCIFIRLHPLIDSSLTALSQQGTLVTHGETVWVDLKRSDVELWQETRPRFRNHINALKKRGVQIQFDENWSALPLFIELYDQTMNEVGAADWYHFGIPYFERLKNDLKPYLRLFFIKDHDTVVCAGLFSECCGIVQYHLSGTHPQFRNQHYLKLMLAEVRTWAKEHGNSSMHLGGGLGSQADGLFFLKSGFSKSRAKFHTWRAILNPDVYGAAVECWQREAGQSADTAEGFFPAYRKPIRE